MIICISIGFSTSSQCPKHRKGEYAGGKNFQSSPTCTGLTDIFLATTTTTARKKVTHPAILNYEIFRFWSPMPAPLSAGTRVSRGEWRRASCSPQCAAALSRCFQELSPLPLCCLWLYIRNTHCCCLPREEGRYCVHSLKYSVLINQPVICFSIYMICKRFVLFHYSNSEVQVCMTFSLQLGLQADKSCCFLVL